MPSYERQAADIDKSAASPRDLVAKHKEAMERFRIAESAYADQSKRELEDLKFAARVGQWRPNELKAREGFTSGTLQIPERVSLVIDKLRQPIQQLENNQRQANLAVDIHPSGDGATKATGEALQGLYRNVQVKSRADQIARFWAYSRTLKSGRGYYRMVRQYVHANPKPDDPARFDQELRIVRILNQGGVLLDPFAQEPDWSDGEWGFVKAWKSQSVLKRERGAESVFSDMDDAEFAVVGGSAPNWVRKDGDTWMILEVEYLYIEHGEEETITGDTPDQTRKVRSRTCYSCKMNAKEIYDAQDLEVEYVPIIPVIANEENLDGERIWEGIVGPAKDSCRTENYLTSAFVETVALAPRSPYVVAVEAIEKFRPWWDQSNVRNFPFLPYTPSTNGGKQVPPPRREFGEPPIQAIAQGMQMFGQITNAITGFNDPSRGNLTMSERSGVALKALQKQTETGNSGYLDNLAQVSMTYESKIFLSWAPKTYDRPGRIERVLKDSNRAEWVMLNAPYVIGPNGQPIPPPPGTDPADILEHQLQQGAYASSVTIGKGHANARDEAAELIGGIIQAEPQLLMLIGDLYFANLDGPGMPELAARMKKLLPPQLQEQPDGAKPDAAALQQQIGQMQQQLQQLQPLADANQAKLQQATIDAKAKADEAALKAASAEKIAQFEGDVKRQIEQIKADADVEKARLAAMGQTQAAAVSGQTDLQQTVIQESAEHQRTAAKLAHEAAGHGADLQADRESAHTAHAHDMEKADHEVANRPPPAKGAK